eukprot:gene38641-50749_t
MPRGRCAGGGTGRCACWASACWMCPGCTGAMARAPVRCECLVTGRAAARALLEASAPAGCQDIPYPGQPVQAARRVNFVQYAALYRSVCKAPKRQWMGPRICCSSAGRGATKSQAGSDSHCNTVALPEPAGGAATGGRMDAISNFAARYARSREEEMSIDEYLVECKRDPMAFATAAQRMLAAIGEPEMVDTRNDPRLSRLFANKVIKRYPAFAEFYGMEDSIEQVVSFFRHAAQGLEERKQILYLLGPVGGGKSSIAERLKYLMQKVPFYALKGSPVNESPLGLFDAAEDGPVLEEQFGIPRRYLQRVLSPWAVKRLEEFGGDIRQFRVVKRYPSIM